jgi:hypothetical protein
MVQGISNSVAEFQYESEITGRLNAGKISRAMSAINFEFKSDILRSLPSSVIAFDIKFGALRTVQ